MINFGDLARSGTAPTIQNTSQKLKNTAPNTVGTAIIRTSAQPNRPKTRSGDTTDLSELNSSLRMNKTQKASGEYESDVANAFKKTQEGDEYFDAIESFREAVDTWSGKSGRDGNNDMGGRRHDVPQNRMPDPISTKRPDSTLSSRKTSATPYTQNVPSILLQANKKTPKVVNTSSPRAVAGAAARDARPVNNYMAEVSATYGTSPINPTANISATAAANAASSSSSAATQATGRQNTGGRTPGGSAARAPLMTQSLDPTTGMSTAANTSTSTSAGAATNSMFGTNAKAFQPSPYISSGMPVMSGGAPTASIFNNNNGINVYNSSNNNNNNNNNNNSQTQSSSNAARTISARTKDRKDPAGGQGATSSSSSSSRPHTTTHSAASNQRVSPYTTPIDLPVARGKPKKSTAPSPLFKTTAASADVSNMPSQDESDCHALNNGTGKGGVLQVNTGGLQSYVSSPVVSPTNTAHTTQAQAQAQVVSRKFVASASPVLIEESMSLCSLGSPGQVNYHLDYSQLTGTGGPAAGNMSTQPSNSTSSGSGSNNNTPSRLNKHFFSDAMPEIDDEQLLANELSRDQHQQQPYQQQSSSSSRQHDSNDQSSSSRSKPSANSSNIPGQSGVISDDKAAPASQTSRVEYVAPPVLEYDANGCERPQSRKLYLGSEKSGDVVPFPTNVAGASSGQPGSTSKNNKTNNSSGNNAVDSREDASYLVPKSKAPRSAGPRSTSHLPLEGDSPRGASYTTGGGGGGGRNISTADGSPIPHIGPQEMRRMSSFGGFVRSPSWDDLPSQRPPSRQSSAFPVHLADVPTGGGGPVNMGSVANTNTITVSAAGSSAASSSVAGGGNSNNNNSNNNNNSKGRMLSSSSSALQTVMAIAAAEGLGDDLINTIVDSGGYEIGGADGLEMDAVSIPHDFTARPPSRQKIAAQNLFDGCVEQPGRASTAGQKSAGDCGGGGGGGGTAAAMLQSSAKFVMQSSSAGAASSSSSSSSPHPSTAPAGGGSSRLMRKSFGATSTRHNTMTGASGFTQYGHDPVSDGFAELGMPSDDAPFKIEISYSNSNSHQQPNTNNNSNSNSNSNRDSHHRALNTEPIKVKTSRAGSSNTTPTTGGGGGVNFVAARSSPPPGAAGEVLLIDEDSPDHNSSSVRFASASAERPHTVSGGMSSSGPNNSYNNNNSSNNNNNLNNFFDGNGNAFNNNAPSPMNMNFMSMTSSVPALASSPAGVTATRQHRPVTPGHGYLDNSGDLSPGGGGGPNKGNTLSGVGLGMGVMGGIVGPDRRRSGDYSQGARPGSGSATSGAKGGAPGGRSWAEARHEGMTSTDMSSPAGAHVGYTSWTGLEARDARDGGYLSARGGVERGGGGAGGGGVVDHRKTMSPAPSVSPFADCWDCGDDDAATVLTENSGEGMLMESVMSMHSLTLESSLGEDFLNLFAPADR